MAPKLGIWSFSGAWRSALGVFFWPSLIFFHLHGSAADPPSDFPRFIVPGHEKEMSTLRNLFWLHYPGSGPKATLWDEWLPDASLWPAVATDNFSEHMRNRWRDSLSSRIIDSEGYVATHQHGSIAHQLGWPFPFWNQGRHGCGWHFSLKTDAPPGYRPQTLAKTNGWHLDGAEPLEMSEEGWRIEITNSNTSITAPVWKCDSFEVPFLQLRWQTTGSQQLQPFIEWTTPTETNFTAARRMSFEPPKPEQMTFTMIPMYRHPQWTGEVSQLRIGLGNERVPARTSPQTVALQAFFSQYDTRHNINAQNFIRGSAKYFWWTRDLNFLRVNINRMRLAMRYVMSEHHTPDKKVIFTTWVGHDGRSGIKRKPDGSKEIMTGQGIGNNYWDILPFGGLDAYATVQYYDALRVLAKIEKEIQSHSDWNIPSGALAFEPEVLDRYAAETKEEGNRLFWEPSTQRFAACVDSDGVKHDYGFTFLNCEAVYYDFATAEHAKAIITWLDGERTVPGDTSQGTDIYHWRFGPRSTTKRNLDWYFWAWSNPEGIPWGGQVQDGGAVLGFSYHDLMARLKILGSDNAWNRLRDILKWFEEIQAAGGYRKYYNGSSDGSLQGSGTPGGLGLDAEFFESAMVPQIMLRGFLGFSPRADGFQIDPHLPGDWPELTINGIHFQDIILEIQVTTNEIVIRHRGENPYSTYVHLDATRWGPNERR